MKHKANPWVSGLAIYEPGRPIEEVARDLGFADERDIIKLASNENALGPSPLAMAAMRKSAEDLHRYPDGGTFLLRKAIADHLGLRPGQIMPGNGSNELIELLGHAFLGPSASIVMADRAFVVYRLVAELFGARVVNVPMKEFRHDLDAMLRAISADTRLVFISNPNNPTSTMVSAGEIDAFMRRVPEHVITCFDEAYVELLPEALQPDTLRYVREGRKVVVLRTFSKTYGLAGLRLGYAAAPEDCVSLLNRVRQPFNVNLPAQAAAIAALGDAGHVERTRAMVSGGIAWLESEFRRLRLSYVPAHANFILVKVGEGRKVFEALMVKGVIVRPMDPYGMPEYIRVTVGLEAENRRFISALESVLGAQGGAS